MNAEEAQRQRIKGSTPFAGPALKTTESQSNMSAQRYNSFAEFWPFYLKEHSRPAHSAAPSDRNDDCEPSCSSTSSPLEDGFYFH